MQALVTLRHGLLTLSSTKITRHVRIKNKAMSMTLGCRKETPNQRYQIPSNIPSMRTLHEYAPAREYLSISTTEDHPLKSELHGPKSTLVIIDARGRRNYQSTYDDRMTLPWTQTEQIPQDVTPHEGTHRSEERRTRGQRENRDVSNQEDYIVQTSDSVTNTTKRESALQVTSKLPSSQPQA